MAHESIEYPPIEDLDLEDMWGGLDFPPLTFPLSRDAMIAAGSAGAGMILGSWGTKQLPFLTTPMRRAAASIAAGLLGGYLLYDFNRPAAAGLSAGMVGQGLATIIGQFLKVPTSLEEGAYKEDDLLGLGLGDAVVDQETLLTGLGQSEYEPLGAAKSDEELLLGLEDAAVAPVAPYELTSLFS